MLCTNDRSLNDRVSANLIPALVSAIKNNDQPKNIPTNTQSQASGRSADVRLVFRPEDFIWLELSMVQEVERVYVEREGDYFDVLIVMNERDPQLRDKLYARQEAVIDALPRFDFDFRILARLNNDLGTLLGEADKPAYKRA